MATRFPIQHMVRIFLPALLAALLAGCAPAAGTQATQWFVETAGNDANDCLTSQTACQHIAAAIDHALDGDTIHIGAGTFAENLETTKSLAFIGQGVDVTIVDRLTSGLSDSLFIFRENPSGSSTVVSMQDMTLHNGASSPDAQDQDGDGGAIFAIDVDLTLQNMRIAGNRSIYSGGGIYFMSTIKPNKNLIIRDSTLEQNQAGFDGGAIWCDGDLTLENVLIDHNYAAYTMNFGHGVGIYVRGNTTIRNSRFTNNSNQGWPYVIYYVDNVNPVYKLLIEDSVIASNPAGGIFSDHGDVTVRRSLISGSKNSAIDSRGNLHVENSTISGTNEVIFNGGGITSSGDLAQTQLVNVTLVENEVALNAMRGGQITLSNTLLSGNGLACRYTDDVQGAPPSVISGGSSLATDSSCRAAAVFIPDAHLGPLGDYGGPTHTYPLLASSPAIDSGETISALTQDQRSLPRPFDGNGDGVAKFDIGAFELQEVLSPPLVTISETPTQAPTFTPTLTATITPTLTITPASVLTFRSQVSVNAFQYQRDCVPNPGQVTITAIPSSTAGFTYLFLFFRLESDPPGLITAWNDGMAMNPGSGGTFSKTVTWKDIPDLSLLNGGSAIFAYQFVALDQNYTIMVKSSVFRDVTIAPCH